MSNPLQDKIKKMIEQGISAGRTTIMMEVVAYDHASRTVDVKPLGQVGGGGTPSHSHTDYMVRKLSVANSRAIKDEGIQPGDFVYIDYIDNTRSTAVVLNVIKRSITEDLERSGATSKKTLSSQAMPVWLKDGE
jgi:hypothetical protein